MKHNFRSFLLALLLSMVTNAVWAYTAKIDGIYYDIYSYSTTATVTYQSYSNGNYTSDYSGDVVIPASVVYNEIEYTVTLIGGSAFQNWIM